MEPSWSGQNHHLARAELAVRLLCRLDDLQTNHDERVLFWGHSHAGNGFALLSNLLANHRPSVEAFFQAVGFRTQEHWHRAYRILQAAPSPHPWAQSVLIAAFGTPVRYGWDTAGYNQLLNILHHRNFDAQNPQQARPMFPPHTLADTIGAKYGDWVQAFGIAGTDVSAPTSIMKNKQLAALLESNLPDPDHGLDTRFIMPKRVRDTCVRWKTGTRCHTDGLNLLINYTPCGRTTPLTHRIENSLLGHGVATTIDWLPAHLALAINSLT